MNSKHKSDAFFMSDQDMGKKKGAKPFVNGKSVICIYKQKIKAWKVADAIKNTSITFGYSCFLKVLT